MYNMLLVSWNRSLPGREQLSAQHFQDFMAYLQAQKQQGGVESFEPILLDPHGDGVHGFFLIKAPTDKLNTLTGSPDWVRHVIRMTLHVEGPATLRGTCGPAVAERMAMWTSSIPK
jgi:hypothetical protein